MAIKGNCIRYLVFLSEAYKKGGHTRSIPGTTWASLQHLRTANECEYNQNVL